MTGILLGAAIIGFIVYLALDHILSRLQLTPKARAVLLVEALGALLVGAFLSLSLPDIGWVLRLSFGLGLALFSFSVVSVATLEIWKRWLTAPSDPQVAELDERLEELYRRLEVVDAKIEGVERELKAAARGRDKVLFRKRQLQNEIQRWQRGGGGERIRSLLIEDWSREYEEMSLSELRSRRSQLSDERERTEDSERAETLRVKQAVLELALIRRAGQGPTEEMATLRQKLQDHRAQKAAIYDQIKAVEADLKRDVTSIDQVSGDPPSHA